MYERRKDQICYNIIPSFLPENFRKIKYSSSDGFIRCKEGVDPGQRKPRFFRLKNYRIGSNPDKIQSSFAFQLPPTTFIDGLPGLDFMRKRKITIDFIEGRIQMDTAG